MKGDTTKLPQWVQKLIEKKEQEIQNLQALKKLHGILAGKDRDWFIIPAIDESFPLFRLSKNGAHQICYMGKGDVLFIGRAKSC